MIFEGFALTRQWIGSHQGEVVIYADADIQFFPRFLQLQRERLWLGRLLWEQPRWRQWMLEEQLDMLFMRERSNVVPQLRRGEVNGGFAMVRCNERSLRFWQRVLKEEERPSSVP